MGEYKPKAHILGVADEKLNSLGADYLVAKKYGRPLQRVTLDDYKGLQRQGLQLEKENGEVRISKEEWHDALDESMQSAFRK